MLSAGSKLGPYEILSPLGAGGMGEVYRARDTRLGRDVAVKVLPQHLSANSEVRARFEREAKTVSSLNHPHICTLFDVGREGDIDYLVMELVDGETLATKIARGALTTADVLKIGTEIADALERAHRAGVVHRDLKPGNIMLTKSGAKLMDFGLARAAGLAGTSQSGATAAALTHSPTVAQPLTAEGTIVGTFQYMAPEQLEGKESDARSDIWALGCVLYEMTTGKRAFDGSTQASLISSIMRDQPRALTELAPMNPPALERAVSQCLAKDPDDRWQSAGDLKRELEWIRGGSAAGIAAPLARRTHRRKNVIAVVAIGVVIGAIAGIVAWGTIGPGAGLRRQARTFATTTHLSVTFPPEIRVDFADLSRDGTTLIFVGRPRKTEGSTEEPVPMLYVRRLDSYDMKPLPGTDGVIGFNSSSDGRSVFFVAPVSRGAAQFKLSKVPVDGTAPPIALCDWKDDWGTVGSLHGGDVIITVRQGASYVRVPASGGDPGPETKIDAGDYRGSLFVSSVLPGDRGILMNGISYGSRGWYYRIALLDPNTGKVRFLLDDGGNAFYTPTGHLLFTRGDALLAAPFDLGRLALTGPPVPIMSGLWTRLVIEPAVFSLGENGTLMYRPGGAVRTERRLAFVDASGNVKPWIEERRAYQGEPAVARDGRRFAATITNAQGIDEVWVSDFDRPALRRVVTVPDADCDVAAMSPDGQWLAYDRVGRDEKDGVYVQRTDGQAEPKCIFKVTPPVTQVVPFAWSPDGSEFLLGAVVDGRTHILVQRDPLHADPSAQPKRLISGFVDEFSAVFSPDGQMVAFASNESGKTEVYVCAFHPDGTASDPVRVSNGGGQLPHWSSGGRSLTYIAEPRRLMSVPITAKPGITAGAPVQILDVEKLMISDFTVLPDGRLFGVLTSALEQNEVTDQNLVLNFFEQLKSRMSGKGN